MAFQPVSNVAECRFILTGTGAYNGLTAQMTLYVEKTDGWTAASISSLGSFCSSWATAQFDTHLNAAWTITECQIRDLTTEFGLSIVQTIGAAGALVGDEAPPNVCIVVGLDGQLAIAPRQGWVMPPLGDEGVLTDGSYTQAFANAVATSFQVFRDDLDTSVAATARMVIVSRSASTQAQKDAIAAARAELRAAIAATRRASGVSNPVDAITARRVVGSQRDRRS